MYLPGLLRPPRAGPPGAGGCFGDFLHNQTAGLNRFAQRRGGRGPGIINAYLLAGLPQSEYNRRG
ncbi:TPA: biopolymer transporter TonB [Klebsiella pneumoniae]|nr:biopolymer transporter TonB [Klebsiella pneumoniae]